MSENELILSDNLLSILNLDNLEDLKNIAVLEDLTSGKITFIDIVEKLGAPLTNKDKNVRLKGVQFLSWLLEKLPPTHLNEKETGFLVAFYCDRLKDHHSVLPAVLDGLLALVNMAHVGSNGSEKILRDFYQHVTCHSQLPADRLKIYKILHILTTKHSERVQSMGVDFIFGLLSLIEGEIDPKNLNFLFSFLPYVFCNFQMGHLEEEAFEVCSRYFPIDFNPAAKENSIVTREELANGLETCLTATPGLSILSLPLLLDKLDSTFRIAKLDSYSLLGKCCLSLRGDDVQPHLVSLWKMIHRDVLPVSNEEIAKAALKALSMVVKCLDNENLLKQFLDDILISVKSLFVKFDDSLFLPSMKILEAVCIHSSYAFDYITPVLSSLCEQCNSNRNQDMIILMAALKPFLMMANTCVPDPVLKLFLTCAGYETDEKIRELGFDGLQFIFKLENSYEKWWETTCSIILKELRRNAEKSRKTCLNLLRIIAVKKPLLALSLLQSVINNPEYAFKCRLDVLSKIADLEEIITQAPDLIPTLISYCTNDETSEESFQCLLSLCQTENNEFCNFIQSRYNVLTILLNWWAQRNSKIERRIYFLQVVEIIMRNQTAKEQEILIENFVSSEIQLECFLKSSSSEICYEVEVMEALLGSLYPTVKIPNLSLICEKLLSASSISNEVKVSACRLLGTFINKSDVGFASQLLQTIFENFLDNVALLCWSLKGALLRGLENLDKYLETYFKLLADTSIGFQVAEGVGILLQDEKIYLNSQSHCNIRILYKQRLFEYFPKLLRQSTSEATLLALSYMIQGVPKQLILNDKSSFMAFLRYALNPPYNSQILLPALLIASDYLKEKSPVLVDQILDILGAILAIAKSKESMRIRIAALECLYLIAFFPSHVILPLQKEVVAELLPILDDKKRLIRREAVRARGRWCLVGAFAEQQDSFT